MAGAVRVSGRAVVLAGGAVIGSAGLLVMRARSQTDSGKEEDGTGAQGCAGGSEAIWTRNAKTYDARINKDEDALGLGKLRAELMGVARGHVLEVAAGTARNMAMWPAAVSKVVCSDAHAAMVDEAKRKYLEHKAAAAASASESASASASASSASVPEHVFATHSATSLPYDDQAFDTVVDTFGLCSVDDPAAALRELGRVCKATGHVLLLEHGRSHSWPPVSWYLDWRAEAHARSWGCWFK